MGIHIGRIGRHVAVIAWIVILLLAVLELAARAILIHGGNADRFRWYASLRQLEEHPELAGPAARYAPHRYLGYFPTPNYARGMNRHNSLGYRGDEIPIPKPAEEFRIVCMGGSTTYTPGVDDYHGALPMAIEKLLHSYGYVHVRVINAGVDGWTSNETLINLGLRVLDLQPGLLVIRDGLNDTYGRLVWPPEEYRGDNSGFREPLVSKRFMPPILEYSTLARIALTKLGMMEPHGAISRTYDLHCAKTFFAQEFERQLANGTYPAGLFRNTPACAMFAANKPVFFERNLESIIALARSKNVNVALLNVAYGASGGAKKDQRPIVWAPEFRAALAEANDLIAAVAEQTGTPMLDIAAVAPREAKYYYDGIHTNVEGTEIEARLVAEFLRDKCLASIETK